MPEDHSWMGPLQATLPKSFQRSATLEDELLEDVLRSMHVIAPLALADTTWDNVGLISQAPVPRKGADKVYLAIDLTEEVANDILSKPKVGAAVIYHPIIFRPLKSLTLADSQQRSLLKLIQAGVSVYCPHTSLDAAVGGMTDWLAKAVAQSPFSVLESSDWRVNESADQQDSQLLRNLAMPFTIATILKDESTEELEYNPDLIFAGSRPVIKPIIPSEAKQAGHEGAGMGRLVTLPKPDFLDTVISHMREFVKVGTEQWTGDFTNFARDLHDPGNVVRVARAARHENGFQGKRISKIAVCPGSGGSIFKNVEADVYVTGELSHKHSSVVLLNHTNSERPYLPILALRLGAALELARHGRQGASGPPPSGKPALQQALDRIVVGNKDRDPIEDAGPKRPMRTLQEMLSPS
ncbi:NGG1p interacting factor 3 [Ceraceosorus guamensis]|uniref:NGG1p interacting factor 3 n=1 Tax=Ceraceosorus guamensis TaxID=1522189 RepID=A0A316W7I0_9BASI|nr:NGG1p interacting factor 3 [Ceraceosorus guamensis]PWN45876.1 NGG1p interacting factor 3 [Ceraceosorus guamensis]